MMDERKAKAASWFRDLQGQIIAAFEELEEHELKEKFSTVESLIETVKVLLAEKQK